MTRLGLTLMILSCGTDRGLSEQCRSRCLPRVRGAVRLPRVYTVCYILSMSLGSTVFANSAVVVFDPLRVKKCNDPKFSDR